jgi:signal transduction histidine kinase
VLPLIEKAFKGESVILPVVQYDASVTMENLGVVDAGGNKPYIQMRLYPIKNDNGEVVNVVSIEEDITSRKQAELEIQQYQERLKALASQLTIAEEKERRVIAADLHDHVGHSLALARMQLESIPETKSELEKNILVKDVSNILLAALQDTRNLISELSSPSMHEIGLGAAVAEYLEEQIAKRHGLKTEFVDNISDAHRKTLDENVRALMFRSVRELLVNVVKHAKASQVRVHLTEVYDELKFAVEDDGIGFDPGAIHDQKGKSSGLGLFSIQERMTDLGGSFDIQSEPDKGCRVTLTVPVKEKQ